MDYIKWYDSYSVGVRRLDDQHKKLIDLLNRMFDSVNDKNYGKAVQDVINEMIAYSEYHFETEEVLMEEYDYPHFAEHKIEHIDFKLKISEFMTKYENGTERLNMEILKFLKDWLINHIRIEDNRYKAFFNSKGIY